MISRLIGFISLVPDIDRTSMSSPLIVEHTAIAVVLPRPRAAMWSYPTRSAVRYLRASLAWGVAFRSSAACWNISSMVVTMFSISELACASKIGIVLISTAGFGIDRVA